MKSLVKIIIGSDNGMSPGRCEYLNQCWNIVNWTPRNKFQWNRIKVHSFSLKKMHLNMSSEKWRPFCLGLSVLRPVRWILINIWKRIDWPTLHMVYTTFTESTSFDCRWNSYHTAGDKEMEKRQTGVSKQWYEVGSQPFWRPPPGCCKRVGSMTVLWI